LLTKSKLQHKLQHTATHCNTLHHTPALAPRTHGTAVQRCATPTHEEGRRVCSRSHNCTTNCTTLQHTLAFAPCARGTAARGECRANRPHTLHSPCIRRGMQVCGGLHSPPHTTTTSVSVCVQTNAGVWGPAFAPTHCIRVWGLHSPPHTAFVCGACIRPHTRHRRDTVNADGGLSLVGCI